MFSWRTTCLAFLVPTLLALGDSAIFRAVREINVPTGWTEPEVTSGTATTGSSYKPSVPEDFDKRDVGTVLDIGAATVHPSATARPSPIGKNHYKLRFRNGQVVPVKLGLWTRINGRFWRVMKSKRGYFLEQFSPRRRWYLARIQE